MQILEPVHSFCDAITSELKKAKPISGHSWNLSVHTKQNQNSKITVWYEHLYTFCSSDDQTEYCIELNYEQNRLRFMYGIRKNDPSKEEYDRVPERVFKALHPDWKKYKDELNKVHWIVGKILDIEVSDEDELKKQDSKQISGIVDVLSKEYESFKEKIEESV